MKFVKIIFIASLVSLMGIAVLEAQTPLRGMSFNGATGLYTLPTGRIGWESGGNLGFDLGFHVLNRETRGQNYIPKMSFSLFRMVELSAALDIRPNNVTDFIGGIKLQLPNTRTAIALGFNFQTLNLSDSPHASHSTSANQFYIAMTYAGNVFDMPAETTIFIGKTFVFNRPDSNIDFGMGFDIVLLPSWFDGIVRWITDFSNFSYSHGTSYSVYSRGVINTGVRIDIVRVIPGLQNLKFLLDFVITDAFDTRRNFAFGFVFGLPVI